MVHSSPNPPVPAELVMRIRRATGLPVMQCKRFLDGLPPEERLRTAEAAEASAAQGGILRDPLEDDPEFRAIFQAVCEEARREVITSHRQAIAELERTNPPAAELFHSGRGLCQLIWDATKRLLRERYGIEWRSPADMNPFTRFD
jgi:hypothetical protein